MKRKTTKPTGARSSLSISKGRWRAGLEPGDEAEILKWVEASGIERVARIVAMLADSKGRRGRTEKINVSQMCDVASILMAQGERTVHSAATEVASKPSEGVVAGTLESRISRIERDFRPKRQVWLGMVRRSNASRGPALERRSSWARTGAEDRILARLVDLEPDAIDLYDTVIAQALNEGPGAGKAVERLGRLKVERILERELPRAGAPSRPANEGEASNTEPLLRDPPRGFLDLLRRSAEWKSK